MKYKCPICDHEFEADHAEVCPHCGSNLEVLTDEELEKRVSEIKDAKVEHVVAKEEPKPAPKPKTTTPSTPKTSSTYTTPYRPTPPKTTTTTTRRATPTPPPVYTPSIKKSCRPYHIYNLVVGLVSVVAMFELFLYSYGMAKVSEYPPYYLASVVTGVALIVNVVNAIGLIINIGKNPDCSTIDSGSSFVRQTVKNNQIIPIISVSIIVGICDYNWFGGGYENLFVLHSFLPFIIVYIVMTIIKTIVFNKYK